MYKTELEKELKEMTCTSKASCKIAVVHGMICPSNLIASHVLIKNIQTNYDYVLCGHNHIPFEQTINGTSFLNPGCLGRTKSNEVAIRPSVLFLDTEKNEHKFIPLESAKKGEEVFDLEKIKEKKALLGSLDNFINGLTSVNLKSLDLTDRIIQFCDENDVDNEIKEKGYKLAQLGAKQEEVVSTFVLELNDIKDNCRVWLNHTFKYAARYTRLGEKGKGVFFDNVITAANILWGCLEDLKPVMAWLETIEESPSLYIKDVEKTYDVKTKPAIERVKQVICLANQAITAMASANGKRRGEK